MAARPMTLRQRVNILFDHEMAASWPSRLFNAALALLIVINVSSVILESVEWIRERHVAILWWIEQVSTTVFAAEYILRVWSAPDRSSGRFRHPVLGRLYYASRPFAVIDLVAVLPAVLGMLGADDLRVLRIMRLLRMLKLSRHSTTFGLLWAVFRQEARTFGAVLFLLLLIVIMSGSVMFLIENDAQPEVFSSIPAVMWWSLVTLTTVGYGDMVPVTPLGKIFGGLVALIGIGTVALFSGVLTVSFMDQLRLRRDQYRHLVESGIHAGHVSARDVAKIEGIGRDMGMPENETEEIMADMIAEEKRAVPKCPHCGTVLDKPVARDA